MTGNDNSLYPIINAGWSKFVVSNLQSFGLGAKTEGTSVCCLEQKEQNPKTHTSGKPRIYTVYRCVIHKKFLDRIITMSESVETS